jgi:hypothetical protein
MKMARDKSEFGAGFDEPSGKLHLKKRHSNGDYLELNEVQYNSRALELLHKDVGGNIRGYDWRRTKI